jgi:hypothetical protein
MKQYLLIFAALLSSNAHAQITVSNIEMTPTPSPSTSAE